MKITRRDFLKLSGATTGFLLTSSAFGLVKIPKALADMGPKVGMETTSICCFCGCGCGILVTTENVGTRTEKVINVEGDPTHPVNEGALCSKAVATKQTVTDQSWLTNAQLISRFPYGTLIGPGEAETEWPQRKRVARVLYRAPYSPNWEVITWNKALAKMGKRINKYRNNFWETTSIDNEEEVEMVVNRTRAIACLGGAAHDNQECYMLRKLMTGIGLVNIEHQARI